MDDLNRAIVLFVGCGLHPYPKSDESRVTGHFGALRGTALLKRVHSILDELDHIPTDWDRYDLVEGTEWAVGQLMLNHSELNDDGAEALKWLYSYAWR